jgi:hypothetical protein
LLTTQQPYRERMPAAQAQQWRDRAAAWRKKTRKKPKEQTDQTDHAA